MKTDEVSIQDDATGRSLTAWIREVGQDLVLVVGGGEKPHVGCVVLSQPYPAKAREGWSASSSLLTIVPHKEEPIARRLAEEVTRATGRVTVVTAGVHEEGLDRAGIDNYLRLAEELTTTTVARLKASAIPAPRCM